MAQLLTPSNTNNNDNQRISQLLPSVKCSICNNLVPLSALGDHVCSKPSPSKAILAKLRRPSNASINQRRPSNASILPPPPPQIPVINSYNNNSNNNNPGPPRPSPSPSPRPPLSIPPRGTPSPSPTVMIPKSTPYFYQQQQQHQQHSPSSAKTPSPIHQFDNYFRRPSDASLNIPPPLSLHQMRAHMTPEPDTKSGGEAGMAGVGRRGFQAAAQAAMFATYTQHSLHTHAYNTPVVTASGFDGRRPNQPGFLNIDPNLDHSRVDRGPLSASSLSPSSISQSPILSPRTPRTPSPAAILNNPTPIATASPISIKAPSYSDRFNHSFNNLSVEALPVTSKAADPSLLSPPTSEFSDGSGSGLPYDYDDDDNESRVLSPVSSPPTSPPSLRPSKSLASSTSTRSSRRPSNADKNTYRFPVLDDKSPSSMRSTSTSTRPPPSRNASSSSSYSSSSSRSTVKSTGGFTRALETLFENRTSSPPTSPSASTTTLPPLPRVPALSESASTSAASDRSAGKLPTRSRTTPALFSTHSRNNDDDVKGNVSGGNSNGNVGRVNSGITDESKEGSGRKHKPHDCTRCDKKILDGRWIHADGAGILCERCWKNMYLPKCRRCGLPIEKQAVSSSDGQLKGKYHRECFNCHTCHEPFPDKEFYVYDGNPFCRYHYHEVNNSLCGSPSCGQPIEGPCAVAHSGSRFHPEHLTCEYDGSRDGGAEYEDEGKCGQRLDEYWEIDKRMLCERHARIVEEREHAREYDNARLGIGSRKFDLSAAFGLGGDTLTSSSSSSLSSSVSDTERLGGGLLSNTSTREARAMKRVTKFIDLR